MNWVDFFIGVVLILTIFIGYKRGLFRELTTFLGLLIAVIVSVNYADWLALKAENAVNIAPVLRYVLAFIVCFVGSMLVFKLIGYYFYRMVKLSQLKFSDKIGGAVFGAFKGCIILSLIFLMFIFFPAFQSFNQLIDESALAPYVRQAVPITYDYTEFFHQESGSFMDKVMAGVLGSQKEEYGKRPESLLDESKELGFTIEDLRVLNNIDKYFGEKVEVATKGAKE